MANGKAELQAGGAYESCSYHAASWNTARRSGAEVRVPPRRSVPTRGLMVTNLDAIGPSGGEVLR